jgi:hypothetical protein
MASRPIFIPCHEGGAFVLKQDVEFQWHPGMSINQKRRSIRSLHEASVVQPVLEISSKSESAFGQSLSAFNLHLLVNQDSHPVENWFQASKSESQGTGFPHLLTKHPREGGRFFREKEAFELHHFHHQGRDYPLVPQTAFYDWIYVSALMQESNLARDLGSYGGFSDIEFNPKRSINCQAKSAALFCGLVRAGKLENAMLSWENFVRVCYANESSSDKGMLPGFS